MWVSPHLVEFTIYFVRPGCQLSQAFDLRPLSYLEHCTTLLADSSPGPLLLFLLSPTGCTVALALFPARTTETANLLFLDCLFFPFCLSHVDH